MSTVEEIKLAAANLSPQDSFELFKWMSASVSVRELRRAELVREINLGLEQVRQGRVAPLDIAAIKAEGRRRLAAKR